MLYGYIENGLGNYDKGIEHCLLAKGTPIGKEKRVLYTDGILVSNEVGQFDFSLTPGN